MQHKVIYDTKSYRHGILYTTQGWIREHAMQNSFPIDADALAQHYRMFDVSNRILLTGHSHQAWPDVAKRGVDECYQDACLHVDDKWQRVFEKWDLLKTFLSRFLNDKNGSYTFGSNTFELLARFISALPMQRGAQIITTESEFHSARRLFERLEEEGVQIIRVQRNTKQNRYAIEDFLPHFSEKTILVFCSAVFYETAEVFADIKELAKASQKCKVPLVVDCYHAAGAIDFDIQELQLEDCFVLGGGYKYLQMGEGVCFLRTPQACELRPVLTGWFAEFGDVHRSVDPSNPSVAYAMGDFRFAGATFDPTSLYRACAVAEFFTEHDLTSKNLAANYRAQKKVIQNCLTKFDLPVSQANQETGAFVSIPFQTAEKLVTELRKRNIFCDSRGSNLRLGPAPYVTQMQIEIGIETLASLWSAR